MLVHFEQAKKGTGANAFTLAEVLVAFCIFGMVTAGMIYGYVQANQMSEWSSQSQAAMSYALQGMERMRAVQWDAEEGNTSTNGPGTLDLLPMTVNTNTGLKTYSTVDNDTLDVPTTGQPIPVTDNITVTQIHNNPALRQIVSQVVWTMHGTPFTITVVTLRAPDQLQ